MCLLFSFLDCVTDIVKLIQTFFRKSSQQSGAAGGADKAQMAFKLYDRDKDGYITKAEMVKLSKNLTKEQVEKVTSIEPHLNIHQLFIIKQYRIPCLKNDINVRELLNFNFRHFQSLIAMVMENLVLMSLKR